MTPRQQTRIGFVAVVAIAAIVFWRTAYPTITWWDSSQMSTAAWTLSVTSSSPNSLLLTLLGWPVSHLPLGMSPAHNLNLFAGLLAALTAGVVFIIALRVYRRMHPESDTTPAPVIAGAALGALAFAFNATLWEHAIKFTPYVLTGLFTSFILWTLLKWWDDADEPNAWRHVALLGLLMGLDFSVHRTNGLLVPGVLAWFLIRRPRSVIEPKIWLAGAGALCAGLAVHLLVIPISAFRDSPLNWPDPSNWHRFVDYVTLQSRGGGFLVDLFPRKSPVMSVQIADIARVLRDDFMPWAGRLGWLGIVPVMLAITGAVALWRRNARLAAALVTLLALQAAITILYFNIPDNFFRSFDRHYIPVGVTIGVFIALGSGAAVRAFAKRPAMLLLAAVAPLTQLATNWATEDASHRYFARDYAANALRGLPQNAIYFTVGDNDTYPVLYMQTAEHLRADVTVLNYSVVSSVEFGDRMQRMNPSFPLSMTHAQRTSFTASGWRDSAYIVPVSGTAEQLGLAADARVPASITVLAMHGQSGVSLPDVTVLDILRTNQWRRPITFAISGGRSAMNWLSRFGRLDGLYWRIVPEVDPRSDATRLTHNLEQNEYRGFADSPIPNDFATPGMGYLYHSAFRELQAALINAGEVARCRDVTRAFLLSVPPQRLGIPAAQAEEEKERCGGID